ncbi:MAG: LysR family transcriptional regulator [Alcaligenaceae bacterium]|jgi:DNA-binding transcriptional LysR family regulator|nr:LysR family transcriptional regulator [Alcaligenaceae bacterium]
MDKLLAMRVFERVADEKGFAAAGRALDISPPVVTRIIAQLEAELGVRLFHRTTRRVALSEAGELYLERVRKILDDVEQARELVSSHSEQLSGVLRISSDAALASNLIAPTISGFRQLYPGIIMDVMVRSQRTLPIEDFDITLFSSTVGTDLAVVARRILQSDAILVAASSYIERRGAPETLQDLIDHDCIHTRRDEEPFRGWTLWCPDKPNDTEVIEVEPVLIANHTDTLLKATRDGLGIASMATNLVQPYLASGEMVRVLAPWITGQLVMYAGFPSRQFIPQRVQVYLDYLIEYAREHNV